MRTNENNDQRKKSKKQPRAREASPVDRSSSWWELSAAYVTGGQQRSAISRKLHSHAAIKKTANKTCQPCQPGYAFSLPA